MKSMEAEIGIIGGTGIYSEDMIENPETKKVSTPYGKPSSDLKTGSVDGKRVAFLFRHGESHAIPPHKVNYRANIEALSKLGVKRIIGTAAVGSLREEIKPGHIVIPDQFIDMTRLRELTFYDGPKVAHVSMADPFCTEMRDAACGAAEKLGISHHRRGTYLCVEGPRFSTRAESEVWRTMGADVIGMTLVPEVVLAREREICYLSLSSITDYDCWRPADKAVSAKDVAEIMKKNTERVKKMLLSVLQGIPEKRECECSCALDHAML